MLTEVAKPGSLHRPVKSCIIETCDYAVVIVPSAAPECRAAMYLQGETSQISFGVSARDIIKLWIMRFVIPNRWSGIRTGNSGTDGLCGSDFR